MWLNLGRSSIKIATRRRVVAGAIASSRGHCPPQITPVDKFNCSDMALMYGKEKDADYEIGKVPHS